MPGEQNLPVMPARLEFQGLRQNLWVKRLRVVKYLVVSGLDFLRDGRANK